MPLYFSNETKLPQGRIAFLQYVVVALILVLLAGFWSLQIIQSDYYATLAERNRVRSIPIIAPRGRILDRDGRVLVDNYPSFSVLLLRDNLREPDLTLDRVAQGLGLDPQALRDRMAQYENTPAFQPVIIKDEATRQDIAFIEAHRVDLPELELIMMHRRLYPREGFAAHLIGYVGEASEAQLAEGKYKPGDILGKSGLERYYNHILMGEDGLRRVIVNSVGKEVGRLEQKPAVAGHPLRLTIDSDVQESAERAMDGHKGALVALDPRTGEILAMVSRPTIDPNLFAVRIGREDWRRLVEDPNRPLLNRAIQAQLSPGSVFKVMMAVAGLEENLTSDFAVNCSGGVNLYGNLFRCWRRGGHGFVQLHRAVVESCDVFFYTLGKKLGIDRIAYYATHLGLGHPTGVDLPGEEGGLVPSPDWKQRAYKTKWWAGETISVAIGQGALTVTPLQLARAFGGIAMGGLFKQPHLVFTDELVRSQKDSAPPDEKFPLEDSTVEQITQAMWGVVNESGTATVARSEGLEICGKTGTAQLISAKGLERLKGRRLPHLVDNAWFVGYAPRRSPEIVVSVLIEQGGHGASAAPLARDVIRAYYEKKARRLAGQYRADLHPLEPAQGVARD